MCMIEPLCHVYYVIRDMKGIQVWVLLYWNSASIYHTKRQKHVLRIHQQLKIRIVSFSSVKFQLVLQPIILYSSPTISSHRVQPLAHLP